MQAGHLFWKAHQVGNNESGRGDERISHSNYRKDYNKGKIMVKKLVIGIDEVGRGCIAGPVTVAVALMPKDFKAPITLPELRDSKKMTRTQREAWYKWIISEGERAGVFVSVSSVTPKTVDRINITKSANLAAWRSLNKMANRCKNIAPGTNVILDGGLFLKNRRFQEKGNFPFKAKTIIGADGKFKEVQIASVVAKVLRDNYMRRMAKKYPNFGFESHKGYGTNFHFVALRHNGAIKGFHRRTFIKGK